MYNPENLTQETLVLKLSNKIQNIDFEEMNYIFNISKFNFESEKTYILELSEQIQSINFEEIKKNAKDTLLSLKSKQKNSIFEDLINKFGIGTHEGLGLMELAEALLRVPDKCTLYELLFDKISYKKNWKKYKNKENGFFINNLINAMSLASYILKNQNHSVIHKSLAFLAKPVIAKCAKIGVNKIGSQFIMGENIDDALQNSKKYKGYLFSYDILGEGARSFEQADFYFRSYLAAINKVSEVIDKSVPQRKRISLSIKLSALHPKYEFINYKNLESELLPKIEEIVSRAAEAGLNVTIDAEECARLPISLIIFEKIFKNPDLKHYHGFGLAVQAYNKSAMYVLKFLKYISETQKKEIPVRLVKGAYWDSEIKKAQVLGLENFHLFTKKNNTDASYIACAQFMMEQKYFYPQFATHNAFTVETILHMSVEQKKKAGFENFDFEFQRLQGMGEALHDIILKKGEADCRIYAPVGPYHDLLAYLVRRILENGASTSFVHLLSGFLESGDTNESLENLVQSPIDLGKKFGFEMNPRISLPLNIYQNRLNSFGIDMGNLKQMEEFSLKLENFKNKQWFACPVISGVEYKDADADVLHCPGHYEKISGKVVNATIEQCDLAIKELKKFYESDWKKTTVHDRIKIINKLADLLERDAVELSALLMAEVGKTFRDCEGEIREAVDFCRYYSLWSEKLIASSIPLDKHHLGESNELTLHPKGVFVCISPWNFPCAIFLGPVAAALLCGNVVAVKPAQQTPLIAAYLVKLMFEAGLPTGAIAFLPGNGAIIGSQLTSNPLIAGVSFTGSTKTAKVIQETTSQKNAAIIPIIAETGGQNCMIIDSSVLPEEAADNVIESAFGSTGQRCSALRVLYLQEEIAEKFLKLLGESTSTRKLGFSMEDLSVDIGPIIDYQAWQNLQAHISQMQEKIIYVHPNSAELNNKGFYIGPHIIKINHISELTKENFGPILHVIVYKSSDLPDVINQINSTGYGLTFGVQSRIESKFKEISDQINAGNIYINRSTIGAVVGVQPFGGMNLSGTGFKAGGPHYLLRFLNEKCYTVNTASARGLAEVLSEQSIA